MDCLFCKIISGDIPSKKVYEDEKVLAFNDIDPQAPVHILVVPKQHINDCAEISEMNSDIIAHIFVVIARIAKEKGLDSFRVISNTGEMAGQSVDHLHFHVLSQRKFSWPPG